MRTLIVVPCLPPNVDGVFDFALKLAQGLRDHHSIENTAFYSFTESEREDSKIDGFETFSQKSDNTIPLHDLLPRDIDRIIIQISNWPYLTDKYKVRIPQAFVDQLTKFIATRSLRAISIFHEIPTVKYKRFFSFNPLQERFSKQLAEASTHIITNNATFENRLLSYGYSTVKNINNFSNIGELDTPRPTSTRASKLVIFGGSDRLRLYRDQRPLIEKAMYAFNIDKITDIGTPLQWNTIDTSKLNIDKLGYVDTQTVSNQLSEAKVGLFDYSRFPGCLGKSGVFAAYKAHGVLPITAADTNKNMDDLIAGDNFLTTEHMSESYINEQLTALDNITAKNYRLYSDHNLEKWVSHLFQNLN